jgi:ferredoxin
MPGTGGAHRVEVDTTKCIGTGICESLDPDRFEVADDGSARVLIGDVDDAGLPRVRDAVDSCPAQAIRLTSA